MDQALQTNAIPEGDNLIDDFMAASQTLAWDFVSTGGGDADGLNNSMIEHFSGDYNYFLAREILQNSLDARGEASDRPVKIAFSLEFFNKKDFPGYSGLMNAIERAEGFWVENKQTTRFLKNAKKCLKQDNIPFLRISDYDTTGLNGSDNDRTGGWFNLVRSTGSSFKESGGGSFGIGKGAPFAASDLRVVFYSTKGEQGTFAFQGKAELVSFADSKADVRRGVGSFGNGQSSVRKLNIIPPRFRRSTQGTDIVIAGYKVTEDWTDDLIKSILRNFWYAIHCGDAEVFVQDVQITRMNLPDLLVRFFSDEHLKDWIKPIGNPLQFYLAVTRGEELGLGRKLTLLGECKFYFRLIEAHMNYVAMLRKSHMVIYSRRFNFPGNFAAVFICDNEKGNLELRRMEPPAHNDWEPSRSPKRGQAIIQEITTFVRECLEKAKNTSGFGALEIPELERYLPFDDEGSKSGGSSGSNFSRREATEETSRQIQRSETLKIAVTVNPYEISVVNEPTGGNKWSPKRKKIRTKTGRRKETGERGTINLKTRAFILKRNPTVSLYRLIIKPEETIRGFLKVTAVGEEGVEGVNLVRAIDPKLKKQFFVSGSKIEGMSFSEHTVSIVDIEIETPFKLAIKVDAYAI